MNKSVFKIGPDKGVHIPDVFANVILGIQESVTVEHMIVILATRKGQIRISDAEHRVNIWVEGWDSPGKGFDLDLKEAEQLIEALKIVKDTLG